MHLLFIANASYLGSYGNAANTVVFPLTVVALAFAVMIGDGACAFTFIFLQSVGQAKESTIISMMREIVFGVGFAILLPRFFGLDGVLYSMPLSDILAFVIAIYFITKTLKGLKTEKISRKHHMAVEV